MTNKVKYFKAITMVRVSLHMEGTENWTPDKDCETLSEAFQYVQSEKPCAYMVALFQGGTVCIYATVHLFKEMSFKDFLRQVYKGHKSQTEYFTKKREVEYLEYLCALLQERHLELESVEASGEDMKEATRAYVRLAVRRGCSFENIDKMLAPIDWWYDTTFRTWLWEPTY